MSSLLVFNRVYWLDIHVGIFEPALWTTAPLTFSLAQHIQNIQNCKATPNKKEGLRQINTCRKVPLQVNFLRWRHLALLSISLIFLNSSFFSSSSTFSLSLPLGLYDFPSSSFLRFSLSFFLSHLLLLSDFFHYAFSSTPLITLITCVCPILI